MKLKLVHDYIQNLPDNDLIMFVDAYDVLITGHSDEIIHTYQKLAHGRNDPALFSAEFYCYPDKDVKNNYPQTNGPYKYLCSGAYISPVKTLKKIFVEGNIDFNMKGFEKIDDQRFFTSIFLNTSRTSKPLIILDNNNEIFNSMAGRLSDLKYINGKWFNTVTKTYPLVLHGNGWAANKYFLFNRIYPTFYDKNSYNSNNIDFIHIINFFVVSIKNIIFSQ